MKVSVNKKLTGKDWLEDLFEYERTHPGLFDSPSGFVEARLFSLLDKAPRPRRRSRRKSVAQRHKTAA